jgi:serine/threonine protein phosphatase 1
MLRQLKSLLFGRAGLAAPAVAKADLPRPMLPSYIVGDIHGRADLLEQMLELIDAHIGGTGGVDPQLIFVGDYIDHGPESPAVLARLQELTREFPENVTCLMGNHERMMLDFLIDPSARGPRWMREGGTATLASYGIDPDGLDQGTSPEDWTDAAAALAEALGDDSCSWIAERPLFWQSGNLWAVHAGADPLRPMTDQTARVLLWGHPEFDTTPRQDEIWIAHGHVVQGAPSLSDGRIGLDTGAWSTGRLSAVAIRPDGGHAFLQTRSDGFLQRQPILGSENA